MTAIQQIWHCEQPYVDPLWAYVKTLLQFSGNTTDLSPAANGYAVSGGGVVSDGVFDSTAISAVVAGGITAPNGFGLGDFCVEYFFNDPGLYTFFNYHLLLEGAGSSGTFGFWKTGGGGGTVLLNTVGSIPALPSAFGYSTHTWNHIAITRYGTLWTVYLNGTEVGSFTHTRNLNASTTIWLGNASGGESSARMLMEAFRVTVGHRRYTGPGFTARRPFPTRGP